MFDVVLVVMVAIINFNGHMGPPLLGITHIQG
jgi:hypothetical protein